MYVESHALGTYLMTLNIEINQPDQSSMLAPQNSTIQYKVAVMAISASAEPATTCMIRTMTVWLLSKWFMLGSLYHRMVHKI